MISILGNKILVTIFLHQHGHNTTFIILFGVHIDEEEIIMFHQSAKISYICPDLCMNFEIYFRIMVTKLIMNECLQL